MRQRESVAAGARAQEKHQRDQPERAVKRGLSGLVVVFLCSLAIPWIIDIGPLRMSVYRLVLIAALLPCIAMWISGKAGRIRVADVSLLLFCFWCFVSLSVVHGLDYSPQSAGITFIETMGPFLLGRCFIRNADDFYAAARVLFVVVLLLLPFAAYESFSGQNLLMQMFSTVMPSFPDVTMRPRWGLRRVQAVFEHPILFGVFCCSAFSLTHLVLGYGKSMASRWTKTGVVAAAVFLSLSSGPLSAMALQGLLIFWNWLLRGIEIRWKILYGGFAGVYMTISLLSNQSVPEFYVHYFAFSQDTGWDRLFIWQYGTASVGAHPFFGIGYNDYVRPEWMEPSIDMFWLINFVRFGIPGGVLMLLAFWSVFLPLAFKGGLDDRCATYRMAHLLTMTGLFVAGWAVHFWFAPYVLFLFLLGGGVWLLDTPEGSPSHAGARPPARRPAACRRTVASSRFT
jgi:hypothetical protein